MKNVRFINFTFYGMFLICSFLLLSFSSPQKAKDTLIGRIAIYDSEPHIFIGILTEQGEEYTLLCSDKAEKELRSLQGKTIRFIGTIEKPAAQKNEFKYQVLKDGSFKLKSYKVL